MRVSLRRAWTGPVKAHVLAGAPCPIPVEAESLGAIRCRFALGGNGSGSYFRSGRVVHLNPRSRQTRWSTKRFRRRQDFPRYLCAPGRQVAGHLEVNGNELDPPDFADAICENARPAASPPAEDHL